MALFSGLFLGFPVFLVGYFFFVYAGDAVLYYGAEGFQERQRILDFFCPLLGVIAYCDGCSVHQFVSPFE